MKERFRAMIEQKDFLANQLKALMKRNKILEVSFRGIFIIIIRVNLTCDFFCIRMN